MNGVNNTNWKNNQISGFARSEDVSVMSFGFMRPTSPVTIAVTTITTMANVAPPLIIIPYVISPSNVIRNATVDCLTTFGFSCFCVFNEADTSSSEYGYNSRVFGNVFFTKIYVTSHIIMDSGNPAYRRIWK